MSKSENQMNTLYLADEDDMIRKKIMKSKTDQDTTTTHSTPPDYIENLFTMLRLVSNPDTVNILERPTVIRPPAIRLSDMAISKNNWRKI
jgi:tryptophanyl-tRNA synthetase